MKRIRMIATGGTIASKPTEDGLTPQMSADELLSAVPELHGVCTIDACQLMNIDSTNMTPSHWLSIAQCVQRCYEDYDGFVITHGTDTMAYTAAALSYLIQGSSKPIILTGSQKSIWLRDTDARRNLEDALLAASDPSLPGVYVAFDGKVICGTRARKMRTKSMNAFSSIDWPEAALIRDGKVLHVLPLLASAEGPVFSDKLDERVFVLRLIPGMDPGILPLLCSHFDGIIIESFGVGGLPLYQNEDFLSALAYWRNAGKPVVITTQVPHEGSDLGVYEVGRRAIRLSGVLEALTMTPEATAVKLMWILGQTKEPARIRELFYRPIAYDLLAFQDLQE